MNYLLPITERRKRQVFKREQIVDWLLDHRFSTRSILRGVIDLQRNATNKTVAAMLRDGALRACIHESFSGPIRLVMPTAHGAMSYGTRLVGYDVARDVERAALGTVLHELFVQRTELMLLREGYVLSMAPLALATEIDRNRSRWLRRPDLLFTDQRGQRYAVEAERVFKNPSRYREIMSSYLRMVKQGTVDRVIYVTSDTSLAKRLEKLFLSFAFVDVDKQRVRIEPHHRAVFLFIALSE